MNPDSTARFAENLTAVGNRIEAAAKKSGRTRKDIKLVAVTKYADAETTAALVAADHNILGESRPQQLWKKADALSSLGIEWHLIGHLQRNKVKRTIPCCSLIHSVDSLRLLEAIDSESKALDKVTCCLLEVNISGESAKHGFPSEEIEAALAKSREFASIKICGLMGMAGLAGDADQNRREFSLLRQLRDQHQDKNGGNIQLKEMSMGMSADFESAIEQGSTIVRIGSILFKGI